MLPPACLMKKNMMLRRAREADCVRSAKYQAYLLQAIFLRILWSQWRKRNGKVGRDGRNSNLIQWGSTRLVRSANKAKTDISVIGSLRIHTTRIRRHECQSSGNVQYRQSDGRRASVNPLASFEVITTHTFAANQCLVWSSSSSIEKKTKQTRRKLPSVPNMYGSQTRYAAQHP